MLNKINKTINISAYSTINGVDVAYLGANLTTEGSSNTNINTNFLNEELYKQNKKEVRKDISDFANKVYEIEDALESEKTKDEETEEKEKKTVTEKQS